MVWHGNWKFAKQKKKHLFTNARYRWLVNMWTAYGGRKDLAAISLQRQTMREDYIFVLTRPKDRGARMQSGGYILGDLKCDITNGGSKWPPMVQKCDITKRGIKRTSSGAKT